MRVAEICPTCATYINASCIVYDGSYLPNTDVSPMDTLDEILEKIDNSFELTDGVGIPTSVPAYVGQLYLATNGNLYIGLSDSIPNWGFIGTIITTTTTTSSSTSSTTTTTTTSA
jgi:hypothetical protein